MRKRCKRPGRGGEERRIKSIPINKLPSLYAAHFNNMSLKRPYSSICPALPPMAPLEPRGVCHLVKLPPVLLPTIFSYLGACQVR